MRQSHQHRNRESLGQLDFNFVTMGIAVDQQQLTTEGG